jgi:hypothetical protein
MSLSPSVNASSHGGIAVELDMDFVRSRSRHIPAGGQGYDQADGSLPLI